MGLFSNRTLEHTVRIQAETIKKQAGEISDLNREIQRLYRELFRCLKHCKPKSRPVKLVITFHNKSNPSTMSLALKAGQSSTGTLSLVYEDDNSPVTGVTFTNLTAVSDNPGVASVTANADATVTANGVSGGVANATINAIGNFSDSSGARSEAVSAVEVISVDAPPPPPRPVKLVVNWSTPV